jgi:hypothetical protein
MKTFTLIEALLLGAIIFVAACIAPPIVMHPRTGKVMFL